MKLSYEFTVTSKLREKDPLTVNGERATIGYLIDNNPVALWNHIHTKDNRTSLVTTAYSRLKCVIKNINPDLIQINDIKRNLYYSNKKIKQEILSGKLGTSKSKFIKINSTKK